MFEIKTKDGRGKTVKIRTPYGAEHLYELTETGRAFIDESVQISRSYEHLRPILTSRYQRTTIVDLDSSTRMTCDEYLICTDWQDHPEGWSSRYSLVQTQSGIVVYLDPRMLARQQPCLLIPHQGQQRHRQNLCFAPIKSVTRLPRKLDRQ